MKILAIEYPDDTVVSISKGSEVTLSDGSNDMTNGVLSFVLDGLDKNVIFPMHTHTIDLPAGETSPPIVT